MSVSSVPRYLIVGSGIAGSFLAWELLERGADVVLCASPERPASSQIAAGLITPITGRRFVKSWNLDLVYPRAMATYAELEKRSGRRFFHPLPILRLFRNEDEVRRWKKKAHLPEFQAFVSREWETSAKIPGIRHEGGGLEILGGGWVDMTALLAYLKEEITSRGTWLNEDVRYQDLVVQPDGIHWRNVEADKVIFCQGYQADNPWFDWLPWKAAQGEILTLSIPDLEVNKIINRGIFLLPLGGNRYRCGATYEWTHLQSTPAPGGRAKLEEDLKALVEYPYEVLDHRAGVRPILQDTFPILGLHPQHPAIGLFNGLGSKGALTAPYYSGHFARHLLEGSPLDAEADAARNL